MTFSGGWKPKPGDTVLLIGVPRGLPSSLPPEDQEAISEAVGNPVRFVGYDEDGRVALEFTDSKNVIHFIFVDQIYIAQHK